MKPKQLTTDATLLGKWEEVNGIPASSITNNEEDTESLDGLLVYGYETKFSEGTNTNGERYAKDAIDKFIQSYFVEKKLNMPVDVEHDPRPEWLAGRIIYIESNGTGFYYVAYIPKTFMHYEALKGMLANKVLQGFSKCGWATDYEAKYKEDGTFDYELIKEIEIVRMSIVSTPANGLAFEKVKEIQNVTRFTKVEDATEPEQKQGSAFAAMFPK